MTVAVAFAPGREVCGVDLSVAAIRLAARRAPEATWVVANADRRLPLADARVEFDLSLFGRRNPAEFARVLRPGGHVVAVVPGPDDLAELREATQGAVELRDRVPGVVSEMAEGFRLAARIPWRDRRAHDRAALEDALAMSYRGARRSERERAAGIEALDATLAAEILVFAPRAAGDAPR
jgi:23S rRNA (guanine745-N1)-methyltransferase